MIKNTFILCLLVFTAIFTFAQVTKAEARGHCSSSTNVQVGVGVGSRVCNDTYVTRRYARPVVVPATVYVQQPQPYYVQQRRPYYVQQYATVHAYPAPTYVEEVYVVPAPRPAFFGLGGLSFSWNFFN